MVPVPTREPSLTDQRMSTMTIVQSPQTALEVRFQTKNADRFSDDSILECLVFAQDGRTFHCMDQKFSTPFENH